VLSQGVAKFDFQAGLRAEHASRDFSLTDPSTSYPYSYNSLFPSGVVLYNMSDATTLKASYSRRIRRPGTQELNPFPSFFDIQNVFLGNPDLSPEYTDAFELGLTKNLKYGTLQVSPFYRRTRDVIRIIINTADVIDGREVTSVSFENLATSNSWGSDVNGSLRLGPKFNGFASFNVFKMVTDGGSTSSLGSNGVTWSSRVNGTTQITPTLIFQGSYFYRAPMKIERGEFAATQMANFSLRKKIDGDKSSVTLRVSDPFNTMKFRIRAGDDNVVQLTERRFGARTVFLTYQYAYGQAPRVRQPRPEDQQQPSGTPFP
jgi:outer membrane receptor protein involved in Fe transport